MAGPFDFLHLKNRSKGSPNELSFDVLDAARNDIASQEKRGSRISLGSMPSQGSYHGVAGASTFSAAPEVERRKRQRRAHSARTWAIAVVAVAALIGAGVYLGYQYYGGKMDFKGRYDQLIGRFVDIDKTLVMVDELMEEPERMINGDASPTVSTTSQDGLQASSDEGSSSSSARKGAAAVALSEEAEDLSADLSGTKRELNAIAAEAQQMRELASNDEDRVALAQAVSAATARADMIADLEDSFEVARDASRRLSQVNGAWDKVLEADAMARDAAEMANGAGTEEATIQARKLTEQARDLFEEARDELGSLESGNPTISFSQERGYLDKRIESLDYAVKTANALLINDREGATSANNAYNAQDREAALLAESLPSSEAEKVQEAYDARFEQVARQYDESRNKASTADSSIRAYLDSR